LPRLNRPPINASCSDETQIHHPEVFKLGYADSVFTEMTTELGNAMMRATATLAVAASRSHLSLRVCCGHCHRRMHVQCTNSGRAGYAYAWHRRLPAVLQRSPTNSSCSVGAAQSSRKRAKSILQKIEYGEIRSSASRRRVRQQRQPAGKGSLNRYRSRVGKQPMQRAWCVTRARARARSSPPHLRQQSICGHPQRGMADSIQTGLPAPQ